MFPDVEPHRNQESNLPNRTTKKEKAQPGGLSLAFFAKARGSVVSKVCPASRSRTRRHRSPWALGRSSRRCLKCGHPLNIFAGLVLLEQLLVR